MTPKFTPGSSKWSQPLPVSAVDIAFPADVSKLMPSMQEIPRNFDGPQAAYYRHLFAEWFYRGLSRDRLPPKPGIDQEAAIRHLRCVIGSFQPKHEHKTEAAAYLMSLWFEPTIGGEA